MSPTTITIESHHSAATLYAAGELTTAGVLEAIACVEQLPERIRALCVDLRAVRSPDPRALRALELALRTWRGARRGMTRVKLAPDTETTVAPLRFAHQRWTPPLRQPVRASGGPSGFRFRDHREATVRLSFGEPVDAE